MRRSILVVAGLLTALPTAASADPPWKHGHGPHRHKHGASQERYQAGGCDVKRKWLPNGRYMEKRKCRGQPYGIYAAAMPDGPPIFHRRESDGLLTCNRELLGSLIGGATGGLVGSRVGQGDGKLAATAAGTLAGVLIGGSIGRSLDQADRACIGHALDLADPGDTIVWDGPRQDQRYSVTPRDSYRTGSGAPCRDFETTVIIGGRMERAVGTACRQPDGQWQVASN